MTTVDCKFVLKRTGERCKAPRVTDEEYCSFHLSRDQRLPRKRCNYVFAEPTVKKLSAIARKLGTSRTEVLRRLVDEYGEKLAEAS
jgi:hypothetical protein